MPKAEKTKTTTTRKAKESKEKATFRKQLEDSTSRYHLEKWTQEAGASLKTVKQAEDSELIDILLTAFDEGEVSLNDIAPKDGKAVKKRKTRAAKEKPKDEEENEDVTDLLEDPEDQEDPEDDDLDDLLSDGVENGDDEDEEEEEEEEPKSATADKLDHLISLTTKTAKRVDKMSQLMLDIHEQNKQTFELIRVFAKVVLQLNKVKDGVLAKMVKKAKSVSNTKEEE